MLSCGSSLAACRRRTPGEPASRSLRRGSRQRGALAAPVVHRSRRSSHRSSAACRSWRRTSRMRDVLEGAFHRPYDAAVAAPDIVRIGGRIHPAAWDAHWREHSDAHASHERNVGSWQRGNQAEGRAKRQRRRARWRARRGRGSCREPRCAAVRRSRLGSGVVLGAELRGGGVDARARPRSEHGRRTSWTCSLFGADGPRGRDHPRRQGHPSAKTRR